MESVIVFLCGFSTGVLCSYLIYYWFIQETAEPQPEPEAREYTGPRYERPRTLTENEMYLKRLKDGK